MKRGDRFGGILVILLLLGTLSTAWAGGTLRGRVINKTMGGEPVAGLPVILYEVAQGEQNSVPHQKTVTDAAGRFEFTDLEAAPSTVYYPAVTYQDVEYFGPAIRFGDGEEAKTSDVTVFETSEEPEGIQVGMEHLIIEPSAGVLLVKELCMVQNESDRTYVGLKEVAPGKRGTLEFGLPDGYEQLSLGGDLMSCCAVVKETALFETMAIKPGMRQESFSYQLKYRGRDYTFEKVAAHGITFMDVFVPDIGIRVEAEGLESFGSFNIRNQPYLRYGMKNIPAGSKISIRLSNLPAAPTDLRWVALSGVAVVLALGIWFAVRYGRPGAGPSPGDRESLIVAIADLDDRFESGEIDEAHYRREREALKQRLLELERKAEVVDHDSA